MTNFFGTLRLKKHLLIALIGVSLVFIIFTKVLNNINQNKPKLSPESNFISLRDLPRLLDGNSYFVYKSINEPNQRLIAKVTKVRSRISEQSFFITFDDTLDHSNIDSNTINKLLKNNHLVNNKKYEIKGNYIYNLINKTVFFCMDTQGNAQKKIINNTKNIKYKKFPRIYYVKYNDYLTNDEEFDYFFVKDFWVIGYCFYGPIQYNRWDLIQYNNQVFSFNF
jgi:hypothetical protein